MRCCCFCFAMEDSLPSILGPMVDARPSLVKGCSRRLAIRNAGLWVNRILVTFLLRWPGEQEKGRPALLKAVPRRAAASSRPRNSHRRPKHARNRNPSLSLAWHKRRPRSLDQISGNKWL